MGTKENRNNYRTIRNETRYTSTFGDQKRGQWDEHDNQYIHFWSTITFME